MKRWVAVVGLVAALSTLVALTAFAQGTDVIWRDKAVQWDNKTGTVFTGTARDTQFIQDENDTTRTAWIKTSNWAFPQGFSTGTAVLTIAYVTITCATNNGAADSLYYTIEKRVRGVSMRNRTLAAGAGACAVRFGDARASNAVYRGTISYDVDSAEGLNHVAPGEEFRLVVQGDVDGTTPKLSGARVTIHYPSRFASAVPSP